MCRPWTLPLELVLLLLAGGAAALEDISSLVATPLTISGLGAAAAVYTVDAQTGAATLVATGAAGVRRVKSTTKVTTDDVFMMASCGKSFTASLFGVLFTKGVLAFTDTIGAVLQNARVDTAGLNDKLLSATVAHLLAHRSGMDDNDYTSKLKGPLRSSLKPGTKANKKLTPRQQREALARWQLLREPAYTLGEYAYSNAGYETAAWLAEVAAGPDATYEGLLKSNFFDPLGLTDAGLGYPPAMGWVGTRLPSGAPKSPLGQECVGKGKLRVLRYDWTAPAPSMFGSGGIYLSVPSLARWVAYHMQGLLGKAPNDTAISHAAFKELHTPWVAPNAANDGDYAKGWSNDTDSVGVPYMTHDGLFGGFQSEMTGYMGSGPGGGFAGSPKGSTMVAVAVAVNTQTYVESGACAGNVDGVLSTLTTTLQKRYWNARRRA